MSVKSAIYVMFSMLGQYLFWIARCVFVLVNSIVQIGTLYCVCLIEDITRFALFVSLVVTWGKAELELGFEGAVSVLCSWVMESALFATFKRISSVIKNPIPDFVVIFFGKSYLLALERLDHKPYLQHLA
ncbi:17111_t:CDS:2, partial [Dentiscutata erythropus]